MNLKAFCALLLVPLASIAADSKFDVRNETEFHKLIAPEATLQKLATGMGFTEGPVWVERLSSLVFSDIPRDELKRWNAQDGLATYRKPSHNANGNTVARGDRLVTCEHGMRRVVIESQPGQVHTLVDSYQGHKLNSPNDVVVKSDGTIWFTDPPYGIEAGQKELPGNYVFCFEPKTKSLRAVITNFDMPNGLCFSPDESKLYVADSGKPHHIRVFHCTSSNTLDAGKVFCVIDNGIPDGIRCDSQGNVWSSAGDGVHIFSNNGELIGKILVPETPANLCFGGANHHTLFVTARSSLYSVPLKFEAVSKRPPDPRLFEKEIKAFEAADRTNMFAPDGIVFVGSSSIRRWSTLAKDFHDCKVLNRGFGGSHLGDCVYYEDRIVLKYKPKQIVLFAGSNDIHFGLSPEHVLADLKAFVTKARAALPNTEIIYVSITTSPSRWTEIDRVQAANRLIQDYIKTQQNVRYVDVVSSLLGPDGKPKSEIYGPDRLHPNAKGYAIWRSILRPYLHCD
jgi:gluconolactonase